MPHIPPEGGTTNGIQIVKLVILLSVDIRVSNCNNLVGPIANRIDAKPQAAFDTMTR
jgi:hypothetical protein